MLIFYLIEFTPLYGHYHLEKKKGREAWLWRAASRPFAMMNLNKGTGLSAFANIFPYHVYLMLLPRKNVCNLRDL